MTFAERNIPLSADVEIIGDSYLNKMNKRPVDWRWRLPELDALKQENTSLNSNMTFQCPMPTLDSFAAFGDDILDLFTGVAYQPPDAVSQMVAYSTQPPASQSYFDMLLPGQVSLSGNQYVGGSSPDSGPTADQYVGTGLNYSIAPAATTQNSWVDIISGLTKALTPAAVAAVSSVGYNQQTAQQLAAQQAAASRASSFGGIALLGGLGILAYFLLKK